MFRPLNAFSDSNPCGSNKRLVATSTPSSDCRSGRSCSLIRIRAGNREIASGSISSASRDVNSSPYSFASHCRAAPSEDRFAWDSDVGNAASLSASSAERLRPSTNRCNSWLNSSAPFCKAGNDLVQKPRQNRLGLLLYRQ